MAGTSSFGEQRDIAEEQARQAQRTMQHWNDQYGISKDQWIIVDGVPRFVGNSPSDWAIYPHPTRMPMWRRVGLVLMRIVGWIILIPSALVLIASGLFTLVASIMWNPANFVTWSIISAVCAGLTAVGVMMTGVMKDEK